MILETKNLTCGYGKLPVLRDVNIHIGAESVALIGPNGAGKTTLINAITGLVRPWGGSVLFDGRDLAGQATHQIARAGIALVPQERELFPGMTVADNLALGAAYIPRAQGQEERLLDQVIRLFPILKERYRQIVGTMSGGQQRMVAIARALMANPKLLILDEPSLGLQPSIVSEVFDRLSELKKDVAILVTEQNVKESLRSVDRGYVLENGVVVLEGAAADLAKDPHVEASYLGL
ncbi:MAG TPA: ABC transporter ATP-binding protein [Spirochaetia bacterium]|nr:ABC transporter ATP-binding protein [Spirochaetales bacterium]HRY79863.1 ABC transporter ATP-binding protein [Spirochaetia bacterium]HRZ88685.1 ABC transporter ATP-binding protein [Spirochaetia bacterium]